MTKKLLSDRNKLQISFFLFLFLFSQSVSAQTFDNGYYRLTTQWQGEGKSLDVINDGENNKLQLAKTNNVTGQFWKITPIGNGYYRLTTQWLGENKSLDVINDGVNNKLQLAATTNASGQFWKIEAVGNGYFRLTTKWLGSNKSLDIINDGSNNKLQLADSANVSGQYWKIVSLSSDTLTTNTISNTSSKNFKPLYLQGFKIMIEKGREETTEAKEALAILSEKLKELPNLIKPAQFNVLKKIPIWIQYKLLNDGAVWYHSSKDWLVSNGYPADLEKSIEIKNLRNFIDWQGDQPFMVLHELAHAYHDTLSAEMKSKITNAYKSALADGKYNKVPYIRGGTQRHYAMNNENEYFAELTESYFGKNDYFPFNRKELQEFDQIGYEMIQTAWNEN
ncbi:MAG TPA: hypothetical protein PKY82_02445 [Pyrinomonadaceae bacterium]|nr:hypothetical protein [Pyrinomonadaceae bacterium]